MFERIKFVLTHLWFRYPKENNLYINDAAVRVRAGMLLIIPVYMLYTLIDANYGSQWIVNGNTAVDTYDIDWENNIIYQVEAIKRYYGYSIQTWVLIYAFAEMLMGMFVTTSRFSPTILLASLLTMHKKPIWKPLVPKRFA